MRRILYSASETVEWLFDHLNETECEEWKVRILTYSFIPTGWVRAVLRRNACEVYFTGPLKESSLAQLRIDYPHCTFEPRQGSHAKIVAFVPVNGSKKESVAIIGSLNAVPTSAIEVCVPFVSREAVAIYNRIPDLSEPIPVCNVQQLLETSYA